MTLREGFETLEIGKGRKIADGSDIAFVTYGAIGQYVPAARERLRAHGVSAAHYDLRFCKPLDSALLTDVFASFDKVITVEDGVVTGGAGTAVLEWLADHDVSHGEVLRLGLPDHFVEHGSQRELHDEIGIGPDGLVRHALALLGHEQHIEAA
jgi:1-deoxy-D-xylulose-5-phosphate synthase